MRTDVRLSIVMTMMPTARLRGITPTGMMPVENRLDTVTTRTVTVWRIGPTSIVITAMENR